MKRRIALVLLCVLLAGFAAVRAEDGADVFSFDFDLRFHMETDYLPYRQRTRMQGYADLAETLELQGNLAWCPQNGCVDLTASLVPVTNPAAAVSFRMHGLYDRLLITSPLLGEEKILFFPKSYPNFALQAGSTFELPLIYPALAEPNTTISAFRWLTDIWKENAGVPGTADTVEPETTEKIADAWAEELTENKTLAIWTTALGAQLPNGSIIHTALAEVPQMLRNAADGKPLTAEKEGGTVRLWNSAGDLLWEETKNETEYRCAVTVPHAGTVYSPTFLYRTEEAEGTRSVLLQIDWDKGPDTPDETEDGEPYPESVLGLLAQAEGLPARLPADSEFTATVSQDGYMLPAFSYTLKGSTGADGRIQLQLFLTEDPEAGAIFTVTGTLTPAERTEPLAYTEEELEARFHLLTLSYSSQKELFDTVDRKLAAGLIDFLYELPVSACQSIMDDLEDAGVLKTLLQ